MCCHLIQRGINMQCVRAILISFFVVAVLNSFAWGMTPQVKKLLDSRRVVTTIYFANNSYVLKPEDQLELHMLVDVLKKELAKGRFVRAEGFASNEGRDIYSFKLALQRAKTVVDFYRDLQVLPEIYLTGYGDLRAGNGDPAQDWRVEIASYDNFIDVQMVKKKRPSLYAKPKESDPPINSQSLKEFKLGHMEALSKFDEPLIIDALAIEQALMEKLDSPTIKPFGSVSQVDVPR
ncbi:MAG: OmpA family protein [Deltaproteobacteria bacterium]|nr:OmpA family protein [Deltaproteobacteria bacterium]